MNAIYTMRMLDVHFRSPVMKISRSATEPKRGSIHEVVEFSCVCVSELSRVVIHLGVAKSVVRPL